MLADLGGDDGLLAGGADDPAEELDHEALADDGIGAGVPVDEDAPDLRQERGEAVERELILRALEQAKGNQTKAAKYLDISRRTLIYRMEKYGLSTE